MRARGDVKLCNRCKVERPVAEFYRDKSRVDGLQTKCKRCDKAASDESEKRTGWDRKSYRREHYIRTGGETRKTNAAWRAANKERHAEATSNWRKNNPERYRAADTAKVTRRKRALVGATPPWADLEAIRKKYLVAKILGFEVDHIVPLRSKIVCGLHVVANLQVIPKPMNRDKSNRTWPDMPEVACG